MWSYYGAKTNVIKSYPKPVYGKIIEPFAGTARYALRYFDREILIMDKYEVVIRIWKWLQQCSPGDILKLPDMKKGDHVDSFSFDCEEAKLLMGFMIGFMTESPRKTATIRMAQRPNSITFTKRRIANSLFKIKHWKIIHGSYETIANQEATWFIDPPYQVGGYSYRESNRNINYSDLAQWCRTRVGQAIVCENVNGSWMDFKPLCTQKTRHVRQNEVIWSNQDLSYRKKQIEMFV
jgi:hypothetical protein